MVRHGYRWRSVSLGNWNHEHFFIVTVVRISFIICVLLNFCTSCAWYIGIHDLINLISRIVIVRNIIVSLLSLVYLVLAAILAVEDKSIRQQRSVEKY